MFIAETTGLNSYTGMLIGLLIAAPLTWVLGRKLNGTTASRTLIDPETGGTVILQRRHTLFFIPLEYWSVACVVLAGLLLFAKPH